MEVLSMKYGYKETRKMLSWDLRKLCINNDWYESGDAEDYSNLLEKVDSLENITTDDIVEIATDIIEHSDIKIEEFENICNALFTICHTFIEIA